MKRLLVVIILLLSGLNAVGLMAQAATPETTPEPTAEATIEPTPEATAEILSPIGELFASLPQTRTADGGFIVGQPDAPITLVEFIDYACPHCQEYRTVIDPLLMQYLPTGQMRYELRLFPTAGGQLSYIVNLMVECAEEQRRGAFWQAYDLLYNYAETGKYDQNVGIRMSAALDLDYDKILDCAPNAKQAGTDLELGQQLGVGGTPAVMVRYADGVAQFITANGRTYSGGGVPLDILTQIIDTANGVETTPEAPMQTVMNIQNG